MGLDTLASLFKGGLNSPKDVLSKIAKNSVVSSRYTVKSIGIPASIDGATSLVSANSMKKEYLGSIKSVTVPSISADVETITRNHNNINTAKKRTIGNMSITFYENKQFDISDLFNRWMNIPFQKNNQFAYQNTYKGDIELQSADLVYGTASKLKLKIFPISVSELSFDNDIDDSLMTVTVTFACEFDKIEGLRVNNPFDAIKIINI